MQLILHESICITMIERLLIAEDSENDENCPKNDSSKSREAKKSRRNSGHSFIGKETLVLSSLNKRACANLKITYHRPFFREIAFVKINYSMPPPYSACNIFTNTTRRACY